MTVTFNSWPLFLFFAVIASAYVVLGIVHGATWLLVLKDKYRNPERYAAFMDLRNARKGKR